jgi:hypothetical protein
MRTDIRATLKSHYLIAPSTPGNVTFGLTPPFPWGYMLRATQHSQVASSWVFRLKAIAASERAIANIRLFVSLHDSFLRSFPSQISEPIGTE